MNTVRLQEYLEKFWDDEIVPTLIEYIKIPNKSPAFDPDWEKSGHMQKVLDMAVEWVEKHKPVGSILHVEKAEGKTPLMLLEIPGTLEGTALLYGHLDKQPEMEGWRSDLGPWKPVIEGEKLYGRGAADDGYALFASLGMVKALMDQNIALPRIVILVEFCEESGSEDLPYYFDKCADIIGDVDLVVCLDSGAGNYEQFWTTVSLRGMVSFSVQVNVLKEGVHSGGASGLVPSSFRIMRELISRIEDENTGEIKLKELHTEIPEHRLEEINKKVDVLGGKDDSFPYVDGMKPSTDDPVEGVLRRTWEPALSFVGMDGIPPVRNGGNVLRPYTTLKLSMRIPPAVDGDTVKAALKKVLETDPPYNASVSVKFDDTATGWDAPKLADWLNDAIKTASMKFYKKPALSMGEGGTIPFMSMLGKRFPEAQFIVTGVLGPESNAHGPNEFLHIPFAKKLSASVAHILSQFPEK